MGSKACGFDGVRIRRRVGSTACGFDGVRIRRRAGSIGYGVWVYFFSPSPGFHLQVLLVSAFLDSLRRRCMWRSIGFGACGVRLISATVHACLIDFGDGACMFD